MTARGLRPEHRLAPPRLTLEHQQVLVVAP
jgi:hypothetical protein